MKILKGNQVFLYIATLILIFFGYVAYTKNTNSIQTNSNSIADIGDATFVSSNDIVSENAINNVNLDNNTEANQVEVSAEISSDDYFAKSKLDRETMYSENLEIYQEVINSQSSLETQKETASQEITKINEQKNKIMICENLLTTKGFDRNVIFINDTSVNVIIGLKEGKENLETEEISQIQNIISREMNTKIDNIHITTK